MAVVVSRYNGSITSRLLQGAEDEYRRRAGSARGLKVVEAPGSYELPALALAAAKTGSFAAVVALGCLIRGETAHDRHIAGAVAKGLVDVTMLTGVPVAFGVLTVDTPGQAKARAGGKKGNKGAEAMAAALDTAAAIAELENRPFAPSGAREAKPDKAAQGGRRR